MKEMVIVMQTGKVLVVKASSFSFSPDGKVHLYSSTGEDGPSGLVGTFMTSQIIGVYDRASHVRMPE